MRRNPRIALLTAAYLRDAYVTRGLTGAAIGQEVGVSQAVVYRELQAAGIPRRARGPHEGPVDPAVARRAARLRMRRLRLRRGACPRPGPRQDQLAPEDKWCPHCAQVQPRTAFRRLAGAHPRVYSWCRTCERAWQRQKHAHARTRKELSDGS